MGVTTADVDASNGVVHIIDNVLVPRALDQSPAAAVTKNIVELAAATADLSTLVTALKAGKLTDALSGGPSQCLHPPMRLSPSCQSQFLSACLTQRTSRSSRTCLSTTSLLVPLCIKLT